MKKILFGVLFFLMVCPAWAGPAFTENCTLDAATTSCTTQLRDESNLGITYHKISVVLKGSNSGSSALLQYSDDGGANYSTLITLASTSGGTSALTAGSHSKWKLVLSSFTATSTGANVTITHSAYYDNESASTSGDIASVGGVAVPSSTCNSGPCVPVIIYDSNGHAVLYNDIVSVNVAATTTGGCTPNAYTSVASSESKHEWKGSAGTLCSLIVTNTAATVAYYRCSNQVSASTTPGSTAEIIDIAVPGATTGNGFALPIPPQGIAFSTGLTCWIVTGEAQSDTTEVGTDDVKATISFK